MNINRLTEEIIGAAMTVHRELGHGLLESTYETCMVAELAERGIGVDRQRPVPVYYKGLLIDCGYRLDLVVDDQVIVELKSVASIDPIHTAQILTYMRLTGCKLGLLINFNVAILKNGIRRIVLNLPEEIRA